MLQPSIQRRLRPCRLLQLPQSTGCGLGSRAIGVTPTGLLRWKVLPFLLLRMRRLAVSATLPIRLRCRMDPHRARTATITQYPADPAARVKLLMRATTLLQKAASDGGATTPTGRIDIATGTVGTTTGPCVTRAASTIAMNPQQAAAAAALNTRCRGTPITVKVTDTPIANTARVFPVNRRAIADTGTTVDGPHLRTATLRVTLANQRLLAAGGSMTGAEGSRARAVHGSNQNQQRRAR